MSTAASSELRPRPSGAGADWATAGVGAATAFFFVLRADRGQALLASICVVLAVATLALQRLARRRTALRVCGSTVAFTGLLRSRELSSAAAPATVTHVTISPSGREAQIWASANDSVMLMTRSWDSAALAEVATRLRLRVASVDEPMSTPEIATRFPGAVPWYGAHPRLATAVAVVVLMALVLPFTL